MLWAGSGPDDFQLVWDGYHVDSCRLFFQGGMDMLMILKCVRIVGDGFAWGHSMAVFFG